MLFYNFNSLDDFIKNELMTSIQSEQEKLNKIKDLYMSKKSNLLLLITNIISETINNIDESKSQEFYDLADSLKDSFEELNLICKLVDVLTTSLTDIISLYDHNIDNNYNEIKADLIEYNKKNLGLGECVNGYYDIKKCNVCGTIVTYCPDGSIETEQDK